MCFSKKINYSLFCILLLFLTTDSLFSQKKNSEWKLRKFENEIAIYTKDAQNSNLKELKAIMVLKTSLSSIVALLNDWDSYPEWSYKCGKSSTLKQISEKELIHYQTVLAPWPVDNRDFIVNVKLEQNEKTKVVQITSTSLPDYIPEKINYVRIKTFNASWTLIPLKDGSVEIVYQLLVNPGGNIPYWIINLALVDGPFETCSNIKKRIFGEKYQKANYDFIKEKI